MDTQNYTCIVCPQSCKIELTIHDDHTFTTTGNNCKRGHDYVIQEYTNPQRTLTTTVKINHATYANIPVVSESPIDRSKFFACLEHLYHIDVTAPVKEGDIIVEDILGTGVNILAARDMDAK